LSLSTTARHHFGPSRLPHTATLYPVDTHVERQRERSPACGCRELGPPLGGGRCGSTARIRRREEEEELEEEDVMDPPMGYFVMRICHLEVRPTA
jgi:hypothetical protein